MIYPLFMHDEGNIIFLISATFEQPKAESGLSKQGRQSLGRKGGTGAQAPYFELG